MSKNKNDGMQAAKGKSKSNFPVEHRHAAAHRAFLQSSVVSHQPERVDSLGHVPALRGRAAGLNPSGKFETYSRHAVDDEWGRADEDIPQYKTTVQEEQPRTVITRNQSPDISFDRSINPYRGCEHGCIYCFARPTHAYMGLSPGLDFETKLFAKKNVAELLAKEIAKKGYEPHTIAIGTNTDPYQPIERNYETMREILKVLDAANHPVGIVTKSANVIRDIDILSKMATKGLAKVALSVTTLDRKLARAMEPRASTPVRRLDAITALSDAGIPTSIMVAPIIPALTDHELDKILIVAKDAGASSAGFVLLRLPAEVSPLFRDWLLAHYPDRYQHVMKLMREMRGGKDYDAQWNKRMRGEGPYAKQIAQRFNMAIRRLGLNRQRNSLRTDLFAPPADGNGQMSLFGNQAF